MIKQKMEKNTLKISVKCKFDEGKDAKIENENKFKI